MVSAARATPARFTVVYPLFDVRGRAATRVGTWTGGQTLAREDYEVVVASDGTLPDQEREVATLLGAADRLVTCRESRDTDLWNAGAAAARTPWLVFTEGHCLAAPDCLAALAGWIAANPQAVAVNCRIDHSENHLVAQLSRRWFGQIHAQWRAAPWPRLHRSGWAVRAEAFAALGGFEVEYGQFSPQLLSARLHARDIAIGQATEAVVYHQDSDLLRDHHRDTEDFARGEMAARARNEPVFFERYFGYAPAFANRRALQPAAARQLARAILAAARARPRRAPALAAELARRAAALAAPRLRVAARRAAVALDEVAIHRLPLPERWRFARFVRAHRRAAAAEQLAWLAAHGAPEPQPPASRRPIEQLGPGDIAGVHALERHGERWYRWTEPVVLLAVALPEGDHVLRIETAGLRADLLDAVIAVVAGGRVLPRDLLAAEPDGTLAVSLPAAWSRAARRGLVLLCTPVEAADDPRRLGLPVTALGVTPLAGANLAAA